MRPLSVGEILDAGIKVVLRHWKPFVACIAGLVFPAWILFILLIASLDSEAFELEPETSTTTVDTPEAAFFVGLGIAMLALFVTFLIGFTACFKVVTDAWLGHKPSVGRSLSFGLRRSPMVLLVWIIMWFALVGLFVFGVVGVAVTLVAIPILLALIVCIIWLGVMWSVALPAVLVERGGPFKALRRSFGLIKGRWWASFVLVLVGYLLVSIVGSVLQGVLLVIVALAAPESVIANASAQVLGYTVSSVVTYPYYVTVITVLYFDQRVRKEGFDLQLMAQGLGVEQGSGAEFPEIGPAAFSQYTPEQRAAAPYWPPPPGWQPPPPSPEAPPSWDPPSTDRPPDDRPADDRPPDDRPPDASPWMTPAAERPPSKADEDEEPPKPDRGRADWQPPEAPRGPGGL